MAEDFQPSNWWNNSRISGFDGSQSITSPSASSLSCSTTTSDAFSWSPATEISEAKPRLCDNQMDSSLQTSGLGFSTLSNDWNQTLLGKAESSFQAMLQEDLSTRHFSRQELGESSSTIPFKDINSSTSSSSSSSSYSYVYSSPMLQGLVEPDTRFQQPFFDSQQMADHQSQMMAYYHGFSNETQEPSWNKLPQLFKGFPQKQQSAINQLQFTNNTPFWNAFAGFYPSALPSSETHLFESSKPGCSITVKSSEGVREKKTSSEPALKKPRIETPSPLPAAFKVRKEKLGDRITSLQQLVSPFGKTDTASVLNETIECIKFFHDQVNVYSSPYLRNGRPMQQEKLKSDKSKDGEESRQDLRSRGLCLVPIARIYTMASDQTTSDLWTSTPGRTY